MGLFMQAPDVRCPETVQEAKRRKKEIETSPYPTRRISTDEWQKSNE